LSDAEKFAIVSLYQLLEGGNVAVFAGVDQIQVIALYGFHFELCRGCHIIHSRI
jgi:hypothetical protein